MTIEQYIETEAKKLFEVFTITACRYELDESINVYFVYIAPVDIAESHEFLTFAYNILHVFHKTYDGYGLCFFSDIDETITLENPINILGTSNNSENKVLEELSIAKNLIAY